MINLAVVPLQDFLDLLICPFLHLWVLGKAVQGVQARLSPKMENKCAIVQKNCVCHF